MSFLIAKGKCIFQRGVATSDDIILWNHRLAGNSRLLVVIGRSNVGKSTLINGLFGKQTARTSKTPGRTREINIFQFFLEQQGVLAQHLPPLYLLDLPGYGHANVSKEMGKNWGELILHFLASAPQQLLILNLQDARHPGQAADLQFIQLIKSYPFAIFLIFNKMDKLRTQKERNELNKYLRQKQQALKWAQQIHFASGLTGQGLDGLEHSLISHLLTP